MIYIVRWNINFLIKKLNMSLAELETGVHKVNLENWKNIFIHKSFIGVVKYDYE